MLTRGPCSEFFERSYTLDCSCLLFCRVVIFRLVENDLTALIFKLERYTNQFIQAPAHVLLVLRRNKEQHEATSARTDQFAAKGTGAHRFLIDLLDVRVRHLRT